MRTQVGSQKGRKARAFLATLIALVATVASSVEAQELVPNRPSDQKPLLESPQAGWDSEYTNWVEVSLGNFFVDGNRAEFQRRQQLPSTVFGGIESLHVEQAVSTNGLFELDGRGIFDNRDYDLQLRYTRKNLGYVNAGFRQFREWYDRSGGFYPPTGLWVTPFGQEVGIDRGAAWLELGLRRPNVPELTLRYAYEYRSGQKDSTSWGDINTTPTGSPRSIVPSFYGIDEKRNIVQLDARHTIRSSELEGGLRYERWDQDNRFYAVRQPGQATERFLTQAEEVDTDVFNAHVSDTTRISERVLLTAGYSFTMLEADMGGSRIYGAGFDAVFDPNFRRQVFDEGFLNLNGSGHFHEHLFNGALMLSPWDNVKILPALRIAKQDESADSSFLATNLEPGAPPTATSDPTIGSNDRDYIEVSESLEIRYLGLTNWLFYARGEWAQDQGDLRQTELDLTTGDGDLQHTDADRFTQKYSLGANWYPLRRVNLSAQYYHKIRDVTYENQLGPPPTTYPGFLQDQNFETDDVNFRITIRPLNTLTFATRYDFQLSTIDTAGDSLGSVQSANITSHIIGESVSWSPLPRLFLQGSFDYVLDETHTPANDLTGAAANLVLPSQNNYWDFSGLVGITVDNKTDLQFQYHYYRANDYVNNSAVSQPYGAGAEENGVTATLIRKLSRSLRWTIKYGFFTNHDQTYGGHLNYQAHLIYTSLQYRF